MPQLFRAIDKLAVGESHEVRTHTNYTSFRLSCGLRRSKNRETAGIFGTGIFGTGCAIVIPSHATLLQLPSGQGFAPTPRKEPEVSDSAVRKKSEVRQKTVVRTLRFSPVEDETIRKKAEDSGLTVSAYIRNAALNKRINSRTDDAFLKELMRLGRMQKHLFVQGKRTGDKEYAEVLVAITELTNTLRKQLMEG